jgi:hypothetical protein
LIFVRTRNSPPSEIHRGIPLGRIIPCANKHRRNHRGDSCESGPGGQFWLFTLYDKDEVEDLTAAERAALKKMVKLELKARRS